MTKINPRPLLLLLLLCSALPICAQQQQPTCVPPAVPANNRPNIFNAQQEMDLGDAMAEQFQKDYHVIDDEEVSQYLRRIGERIAQNMPQTGIKYQFFIVDLPEVNAFTIAGGRVYVTRKLIAFARSEDELAGVIAHELGHNLMHHAAVDITRLFRENLGVTSVTDRRDIFEKYNLFIESARRKGTGGRGGEEEHQLEADRAGLYAMMAAGYDPQAFSSFWDRFVETRGKTGNWFTDLFGTTRPEQKRLREMLKAATTMSPECIARRTPDAEEGFKKWQAALVVYSGSGRREQLHGVIAKMNLEPPLRGEITHLRFSPDGKYILAQDDSGINLLTREPFAIVSRIEAPEAKPAMFTPDSLRVVFYNSNLRVESWNVADGTKADTHEVVLPRRSCLQTELSSDGKTLACYDTHYSLSLYDVATSQQLFEKKEFYVPQSFFEWLSLVLALRLDSDINLLNMQFSPDNQYFLAARSGRNRVLVRFDALSSGNEKVALAVDLQTRKPVSLGGSLKEVMTGGFAFHSPTEIIGEYYMDSDRSGIYSFPDGKKIEQFKMLGDSFTMANQGDYVIVRPVSEYPAGIYDVKARKIIVGNKQSAIDVYGTTFVAERRNGELGLYDLSNLKALSLITLPRNTLGALRVAEVSPDLKWLAVSERSRGAVWELSTGRRIFIFHIRGFRGAYFADDGQIYADFPKYEKTERTIAHMMPAQQDIAEGIQLPEADIEQYGPYLVQATPASEKKGKAQKEKNDQEQAAKKEGDEEKGKEKKSSPNIFGAIFGGGEGDLTKNINLEVRDARQGNTLWSRNFADEAPERWGNSEYGTLTLSWHLSSKAARNIIKADDALSQRAAAMGDKEGDYLLQVLELKTGKVLGQLLIETGKGSFDIANITAAGDWVVVSDTKNRVLVYSLGGGQLKQRFFGSRAAINARDNLLCVENERGQLIVYNLETGARVDEFSFSSPVSLIQFVSGGKQLFVLTANQTAYLLKIA